MWVLKLNLKFVYCPLCISDSEILMVDDKSRHLPWSYPPTRTSWITFKQIIEMHWFGARSSQLCQDRPGIGRSLVLHCDWWRTSGRAIHRPFLFSTSINYEKRKKQVVNCKNSRGCKPFLSNIDQSLKARFLTPSMTSAKMASSLAIKLQCDLNDDPGQFGSLQNS